MRSIRDLMRSQQYHELSDCDGESPLDAAIRETREELAELERMKSHAHQWSGDTGFCVVCGWDGNA